MSGTMNGVLPKRLGKIEAKELQVFWDSFFTSDQYRENLKARILIGKGAHMEVLLHHMVYGKPKETLALTGEGDGILILQIGDKVVRAQALEDGTVRRLTEGEIIETTGGVVAAEPEAEEDAAAPPLPGVPPPPPAPAAKPRARKGRRA